MQVSPTLPSSFFSSSSQDMHDFLNSELFSSSSSSASSPASSTAVQTPPQSAPLATFPDVYSSSDIFSGDMAVQSDLFNFLQGNDIKSNSSFDDFLHSFNNESLGIDPSLMSSQSPISASSESPIASTSSASPPPAESPIEPVKAGGHGKARKGTVQSGGVVKKSAPARAAPKKETKAKEADLDNDNEDDDEHAELDGDIPASWRPAPEVYAKMTSKEKRQLRNKISARNFRVRRKEYISTLELDIAERDRLLTAIRSELGSTQSENQALRREIDSLKNVLLGGRPAPVKQEPSPTLPSALFSSSYSAPQDILSSPMWGSGLTSAVHTVLMPEWGSKGSENINPALNASAPASATTSLLNKGFDGFADSNSFTLRNLDAYRMQLWTKMATQHMGAAAAPSPTHSNHTSPSPPPMPQAPRHSPLPDPRFSPSPFTNPSLPYLTGSPTLHGLASNMGVKFFRESKPTPGASLGSILSGKHQPSSSPFKKPITPSSASSHQPTPEQALIATLAHQTLFKRLGGAFWDAFSGEKSASSPSSSHQSLDSDKVRRVLEGKAVVRVVDVEPTTRVKEEPRESAVCSILEESMRSLTLGKK